MRKNCFVHSMQSYNMTVMTEVQVPYIFSILKPLTLILTYFVMSSYIFEIIFIYIFQTEIVEGCRVPVLLKNGDGWRKLC